jgi:hypothetical protein
MGKRMTNRQLYAVLIAAGLILIFGQPLLAKLFTLIGNSTTSDQVQMRMFELADSFNGISTDGDVSNRMLLYMSSISGFFKNPIFGGKGAGGHSYILDLLANYGILGGFPLLWIYTRVYHYMYKPFRNQPFFGYMLFCFVICILMAFLNTSPNWFAVTCIVPLCGYYLSEIDTELN